MSLMLITFYLSCLIKVVRVRPQSRESFLNVTSDYFITEECGQFYVIIKKKNNGYARIFLPSTGQGNVSSKMDILDHDKMSSRVVLENDGAAHGKVTDNILRRFRERGSRVIARLVQFRRRALFRILKKNQRIELDYNEGDRPSGKGKILEEGA